MARPKPISLAGISFGRTRNTATMTATEATAKRRLRNQQSGLYDSAPATNTKVPQSVADRLAELRRLAGL